MGSPLLYRILIRGTKLQKNLFKMKTLLSWRKGVFSNTTTIFEKNKSVGFIRSSDFSFSRTSTAEIYGRKILFQNSGFFETETLIIDASTNQVIGRVHYSLWGSKADIEIDNEFSKWEYRNLWNTKWDIFNSRGLRISYESSLNNGWIETNKVDAMNLLSGLYVSQYYERKISYVAVFCSFIPLLMLLTFFWR